MNDMERDEDADEKAPVLSRKCYSQTIWILCSKFHNPSLSP